MWTIYASSTPWSPTSSTTVSPSSWRTPATPSSVYQGFQCRSAGDPVLNLRNPEGTDRENRRAALDVLAKLNRQAGSEFGDAETATLLHLIGIEAGRFSYPYQGLNQKLVGVKPAKVIKDLLA